MAEAEQDFNPFQAPRIHEPPEQRLAEDQQFLISKRDIICRKKVILPQLCIHTGEIQNLVERQKVLYAPAGATYALLAIALGLVVIAISISLQGQSIVVLTLLALLTGLVSNHVWKFLPWSLLLKVDATWYLSERYLRRVYWEKIVARVVITGVCGALGTVVGSSDSGGSMAGRVTGLLAGAMAGLGLSLAMQTEKPLTLRGTRYFGPQKGLMVLQGHSRHFRENAQRIAGGAFAP